MKKILVTGFQGKLGNRIFSSDINTRFKYIFLSRIGYSDHSKSSDSYVVADLSNERSIDEDLWGANEILHMAGATHERRSVNYYKTNYLATKALVEKAEKRGIERFIYLSSQAIGKKGGAYSHSKDLTEKCLRSSSINWTIIRPSEVYGEGMNDSISSLCNLLSKSWLVPVIGDGKYEVNPIHVDDFVEFILRLLKCNTDKSYGKTYVLAGPHPMSFKVFCRNFASTSGKKPLMVHLPVTLCKLILYVFSFLKITKMVPDQIDRLLLEKDNDIGRAILDYEFKPREFSVTS
jgi:nucleoside-diphosphate-sugar epimerase